MREGTNPLRHQKLPPRPDRVAAVVTHLPTNREGYHADRLKIVQASLLTMQAGAQGVHRAVWDNGSCSELTDWLINVYQPDTLVLSPNVGKDAAHAALLRMFPFSTVISLADDDMLYYPRWFEKQHEILEGFPNVGLVSGYPVRTQFRWATSSALQWARNHKILIEEGRFIPDEWEEDFATSIGRDPNYHRSLTVNDKDFRISFAGLQAYATAHHCQYMGMAGRLAEFRSLEDNRGSIDETKFDTAVDKAGFLRLTTTERLVRHIGNRLDESVSRDLAEMMEAAWV